MSSLGQGSRLTSRTLKAAASTGGTAKQQSSTRGSNNAATGRRTRVTEGSKTVTAFQEIG
jgi:hypothetical protein